MSEAVRESKMRQELLYGGVPATLVSNVITGPPVPGAEQATDDQGT